MRQSLTPEMLQCGRRRVFCGANAEAFADALAQLFVDARDAGLAIEFDEAVALSHGFKFALDHRLVANEGPVEIVRERHVAAGFPIADGLRFFEFASEGCFRAYVEPEGEMRTERHGVEARDVIAADAAHH